MLLVGKNAFIHSPLRKLKVQHLILWWLSTIYSKNTETKQVYDGPHLAKLPQQEQQSINAFADKIQKTNKNRGILF